MNGETAEIERDIAKLENQLAGLHARKVELLQEQLREAQLRASSLSAGIAPKPKGRPPGAVAPAAPAAADAPPKKKKRAAKKKAGGGKRTRMSSEFVEKQIVGTVKAAGKEGLSLKAISDQSGINYQTTAKKLKEMPIFIKKGKLKQARYIFKG